MPAPDLIIGVDTGGTFTDTVILSADGKASVGKALTTHGSLLDGVMNSLQAAAAGLGLTWAQVLQSAAILSHGTTIGLNALLTDRGATVGLLTTEGFESTLAIARSNKVHGLSETESTDALQWRKPKLLVPRRRTLGVRERIDSTGVVVIPLDEEQARGQIRRLLDLGVDAIGVALMWSPVDSRHERRLAELIADEAPGVPVSISSSIAARIGEYERTVTAALNAYVAPLVSSYLDSLETALQAEGFTGLFLIMTMGGGVRHARSLREAPVHSLQSGPVGGITATRKLGEMLGHRNIIATDVGGTSFDVGLVVDGALPRANKPRIDRHALAIPVIDLGSIGTGGGSIAWIDKDLGALHVGPQSAGSMPGPACYGRGGQEPTVTDAAAVLGYLERLGATLELDREAAAAAVGKVASELGVSLEEAAEGILAVACAQMADLVRRSTIQRGYDPRSFALYGYGGAAPQYVGRYAADIGVSEVVVPRLAPEFSAWGAVCSDLRVLRETELPPRLFTEDVGDYQQALERMAAEAADELKSAAERLHGSSIEIDHFVGLRFVNQIHRIDVRLTDDRIADEHDRATARFREDYERIVGRGSAYADSAVEIVSVSVEARIAMPASVPPPPAAMTAPQPRRTRHARFGAQDNDVSVYGWEDLPAGHRLPGPVFIESPQTTVVVYPGQTAVVGDTGDLILALTNPGSAD